MTDFCTGLRIIWRADNALDCLAEDEVGELVAGKEGARQGPAVGSEDEDLFCWAGELVLHGFGSEARGWNLLLT